MSLTDDLRARIEALVSSQSVFVFMKGSPEAPECGFSAQVVQILDRLVREYGHFDVLSDSDLREGIKEYAEWPTVPQLYVGGEFMGGCDIVREMYASGELQSALGLAADPSASPALTVTDAAAEVLLDAKRRAGGAELHLSIDARFRSQLGFGPRESGDREVDSNGITLLLDRETVPRAQGISIDAVDTPEGRRLTLDNPNAPPDA